MAVQEKRSTIFSKTRSTSSGQEVEHSEMARYGT